MLGKERMPKYWLPWLVGMPAETSLAICSMIFGGVFDRFPRLRVAFAHGGGAFPFTIGRIEHAFHVRPDLCATDTSANPRSYLARENKKGDVAPARFYVDSLVHDPDALKLPIPVNSSNRLNFRGKIRRNYSPAPPANSLASDFDIRIFAAKQRYI